LVEFLYQIILLKRSNYWN